MDRELEVAGVKVRWDIWNNPEGYDDEVYDNVDETETSRQETEKAEVMSCQVYDWESKSICFTGRRSTDSSQNTHVYLPKAAKIRKETGICMRKDRLLEVAKEVGEEVCKESNLERSETEGLKTVCNRIKEGEIVVLETDKSGKFTVMGQDAYLEAGDKHVVDDEEFSEKKLRIVKRKLNAGRGL